MAHEWIVPDWPAPARVRAMAITRQAPGQSTGSYARCNLGLGSGDSQAAVLANREAVGTALALPSAPVWLQQVHGSGVLRVDHPLAAPRAPDAEPEADAAVTQAPATVLAVLSADCLPVLFAAADGSCVGAAHAGWRGLAAGVLERCMEAMPVAPAGVLAWLGPAIGPDRYEVGEEVRAAFVDPDGRAAAAFRPTRPGHWLCDLYALARLRLAAVGLASVHGGGLCTFDDARRFHSHRRNGGGSGRQATLIWLDSA